MIRTTILQSHVHMQVASWDNNEVVMLMIEPMGNSCIVLEIKVRMHHYEVATEMLHEHLTFYLLLQTAKRSRKACT